MSNPCQEARIARWQHYRAARESIELQAKKMSSDPEKKVVIEKISQSHPGNFAYDVMASLASM